MEANILGKKQYLNSKIGRIRGRFYLKTSRALAESLALVILLGKQTCGGEMCTVLQQTCRFQKRTWFRQYCCTISGILW